MMTAMAEGMPLRQLAQFYPELAEQSLKFNKQIK